MADKQVVSTTDLEKKSRNCKWGKVFKSGLSKFCGRQPLENLLSPFLNTLCQIWVKNLAERYQLKHI